MTEQLAFNVYCYALVGFLGNALIGWELGQKGWLGLGLEGPRNSRVTFALACFIGMILWQSVRKLDSPFTLWRDLWIPAWGICVFMISRLLVPKSMRLYRQAKFLHETTYVGDWLKPEYDGSYEKPYANERLLRAEDLYLRALAIQKHLSEQLDTDQSFLQCSQNVAITYLQLTLLYLQQRDLEKAASMVQAATEVAEALNRKYPHNPEVLYTLSNAFFRTAELEQVQGRWNQARVLYRRSLDIDMNQHNEKEIGITESRLQELDSLEFGISNNE